MRSTDAQKRDATRVISARRVMFAALVICALIFGGTLLGAIPGVSGALSTSGDSEASAASTASGNSEVFAEKAFAEPAQSSSEDNSKEVSIGYYYGYGLPRRLWRRRAQIGVRLRILSAPCALCRVGLHLSLPHAQRSHRSTAKRRSGHCCRHQ